MTVIETIVRGVQSLPLREQVEGARYVHRLSVSALGETDGKAFERAMHDARRAEAHG